MSLNEATPEQWDALRKKHSAIVEASMKITLGNLWKPSDRRKDYLEYPSTVR